MGIDPISSIADAGKAVAGLFDNILEKIFPDPVRRAEAEAILRSKEVAADIDLLKTHLSVFLAEAQSTDKWTSRARPSFAYVMYIMILWAIPYSVIYAIAPETATDMADGLKKWLAAIPEALWGVFAACFSVWSMGRSYEKRNGVTK